jgi:hypothetical protein
MYLDILFIWCRKYYSTYKSLTKIVKQYFVSEGESLRFRCGLWNILRLSLMLPATATTPLSSLPKWLLSSNSTMKHSLEG